jgi:hypothetical protein
MAERAFIVTFDLLDPTLDWEAFKEFVKTSKMFKDWWNHIPGIFLVTSESDAATISAEVRRYTKNARLLVMEVQPAESDGLLTETAWKWIRGREQSQPGVHAASES